MTITWLLYGSLRQRTGGTIYDREIVQGLSTAGIAVDVMELERGADPSALVRRLVGPRTIVGDELCFRELAFAFPRLPGARRVLLVHHLTCWEEERPPAERARARVLETAAQRSSDAIVTTSHATRQRLEREGARRPIHVIHPGSDRLERAHARCEPARTDRARFLFVGAVTPRKRVRELVRALPAACELRVVGATDREPRYAASVRELADARVSFLGEVDEPELARELAGADALVMPSSLEGYGIAATEAIAAGTPVIAARTEGLEEALSPCPDAVRFVDVRGDSLGRALEAFATDDALRARMRAAATGASLPTWASAARDFAHRAL